MKYQKFFYFLLLAVLVVSYQNCTGHNETISISSQSKSSGLASNNGGGNGDYYGGKIAYGKYVRPLPNLNCGPGVKYLGEIKVSSSGISGKFVDPNDCTVSQQDLTAAAFEFAEYDHRRIGYIDGIYFKKDNDAAEEVWCRKEGSTGATGFDVVIKADYLNKNYWAEIVSGTTGSDGKLIKEEHEPVTVRREFDIEDRLRYRSSNFELDIRTRTFNSVTGTFSGEFKYEAKGLDVDMYLTCRLGGEMDTQSASRPF